MYVGKRKYDALTIGTRDMLQKVDELYALYQEVSPDDDRWVRIGQTIASLRKMLTSELRDFELGLWEQNGYPTTERRDGNV